MMKKIKKYTTREVSIIKNNCDYVTTTICYR